MQKKDERYSSLSFVMKTDQSFWLLTVIQNYNTMMICYDELSVSYLHFTKHGKCVGDETEMRLLTKWGCAH